MRVLTFVVTCDYIDFWTLCFAHHFVYCCHFTRFLIKFFACLYLTTMQILWARKYEYGVLFITHAREIFKSLVFDSWLENFSSICDEQNTILTFPPHSIYTLSPNEERQCRNLLGSDNWALSGSSEPTNTMVGFRNLVVVGIGPLKKNWLLCTYARYHFFSLKPNSEFS